MVATNAVNCDTTGVVAYNATTGAFTASTLTQHDVLVGGASNAITSVAPSTAGFVLTSNGAGSDPSFQAQTGGTGGWNLIQSQTVSNVASVPFTTNFTYKNYVLLFRNVTIASNGQAITLQYSTNGGTSYVATGYLSTSTFGTTGAALTTAMYLSYTGIIQNFGTSISTGIHYLYNLTDTSGDGASLIGQTGNGENAGTQRCSQQSGSFGNGATAVNAIQVIMTSGNISGTFILYGFN